MRDNSPMRLSEFEALVKTWRCRIEKTTKEWEIRDNTDDMRITGFSLSNPDLSNYDLLKQHLHLDSTINQLNTIAKGI